MTDRIISGLLLIVVWLCGWAGGWTMRGERQRHPANDHTPAEATIQP